MCGRGKPGTGSCRKVGVVLTGTPGRNEDRICPSFLPVFYLMELRILQSEKSSSEN